MQSWLRSTSNCVCVYWLVRTAATGAAGSTCCGRRTIERQIKAARLPATKSLDGFDFAAIPSLNKMQVLELARREWIDRCENVIALGPSGTGKTHVALSLGLAACQKGVAARFTTVAAIVTS